MNNRRNDYRHPFAVDDRLRVELTAAGGRRLAAGQIVDLSVGGLAYLGDAPIRLDPAHPVVVHFAIPHGLRRLAIPAAVVYTGAEEEGSPFGLRFLPLDDADAQEERDKALWVFLLDEQRRERRRRRGEAPG
ncbi:MAG TPA: PilZ domain-containing protein [Gemmataceae bacterium]|nr:PilZ domain-containing protein [Gemmataceae bacterium]